MIGKTEARRRASTLLAAIAVVGVIGGMAACSDDDDIIIPAGSVTTFADSSFDFTTLHTFAMADTVAHLVNVGVNPVPVTDAFDATILSQVRTDLLARGYTEVDAKVTRPDFEVLTGVSASDNYNAFIGGNWFAYWGTSPIWGWLPGGVDPSWTIIYPWFRPGAIVTFQRTTLLVTIVPTTPIVNPLLAQKEIRAAWAGVATSLLGQQNITQATVQNAINIMFQQSPYLTNTP
jgi:hypothetical protein